MTMDTDGSSPPNVPAAAAAAAAGVPAAEQTITTAFPEPPNQLIQLYSEEDVCSGSCPLPPDPLPDGIYSMFGCNISAEDSIILSLESQGVKRLYPRTFDRRHELKKMNHSLLFNFVDLVDMLSKCPDTALRDEKCQDIHVLFIQMHHLINEMRPHQARETIRVLLLLQRRARITTADAINQQIITVTESISKLLSDIPDELVQQPDQSEEQDTQLPEPEPVPDQSDETCDDTTDDLVQQDFIMCKLVLTDVLSDRDFNDSCEAASESVSELNAAAAGRSAYDSQLV
jgi:mediator of RNA polymerase II transcription subunit 7